MMPPTSEPIAPLDPTTLSTPAVHSHELRMSYRIARGEQGVLTFEPYKSLLLPHWRFRTEPVAQTSSASLRAAFDHYVAAGDFVGADMARKFVQMGMTRAKRYANHKGGRKYERGAPGVGGGGSSSRAELPKSRGHEGQEEKARVSELFKGVWRSCTGDEKYLQLKREFVREQREWDRAQRVGQRSKGQGVREESDEGTNSSDD